MTSSIQSPAPRPQQQQHQPASISHAPRAGNPSGSSRGPARGSGGGGGGADAFPALPVAQKPGMNVSRPGYGGNPVIRRGGEGSVGGSVWGAAAGGGIVGGRGEGEADVLNTADPVVGTAGATAKGKGKGKGKQVMMHWG